MIELIAVMSAANRGFGVRRGMERGGLGMRLRGTGGSRLP